MNEQATIHTRIEQAIKQGKSNLTAEQLRLWFLLSLDARYPINESYVYEISKPIDLAMFQHAVAVSVDAFSVFRSVFLELYGCPIRKELDILEIPFNFVNEDDSDGAKSQRILQKYAEREFNTSFNLEQGPLFRFTWVAMEYGKSYLYFTCSKFVADSMTARDFITAVFNHYLEIEAGDTNQGAVNKSYFNNVSKFENRWLQSDLVEAQVDFWKKQLLGLPALKMPLDKFRPSVKTHNHASCAIVLKQEKKQRLTTFSQQNNIGLERLLLAVFAATLYRYSQHSDFAIGVTVDRRPDILNIDASGCDNTDLYGPISNTLPLRFTINESDSIQSLLSAMAATYADLTQHALLPLKTIVERVSVSRDLTRSPLFQVEYGYENIGKQSRDNGLTRVVQEVPFPLGKTSVDLSLDVMQTRDMLRLRLSYNADLFDQQSISNILNSYTNILDSAISAIEGKNDTAINRLPILNRDQKDRLLSQWNQTEFKLDPVCVHQLFEQSCQINPNRVSVSCQGESLYYLELNERSNQLAHHLVALGLNKGSTVALSFERSNDIPVVLLSVLKCGLVCLPVDPDYPRDHIRYMLEDSNASLLITSDLLSVRFDSLDVDLLKLDTQWPAIANNSRENMSLPILPEDPAYLIYTSGSTGKSKAVLLAHAGIVNNITWRQKTWKLDVNDKVLQNSSFSFDPSIWSTFWPLSVGASLVISPKNYQADGELMAELIENEGVTVIGTVPSVLSIIVANKKLSNNKTLRLILSGGEVLSSSLRESLLKHSHAELANLYGPTETSMDASCYHCIKGDSHAITPIGKPIGNMRVYLLDEQLEPVPAGVKGEIYVAGVGVALGYFGREDLNKTRFVNNPFDSAANGLMYKTGDFGRYLHNGNIEFSGRSDEQVKINGFRIELPEIEHILSQHPGIEEAAVITSGEGEKRLNAFLVLNNTKTTVQEIKEFIKCKLPPYMVPATLEELTELPKKPNFKIDRLALSDMTRAPTSPVDEAVLPGTVLEKTVAKYFCEVLGVSTISLDDDFFELGGTSLFLTRLSNLLFSHFDIAVPLHQFFKIPTVKGVAGAITILQRDGLDILLLDKHISKLEEDATLDDDINIDGLTLSDFSNPKAVFLTGATGYIGAFILEELLLKTDATVYCLVRGESKEKALGRLKGIMQDFLIWKDEYAFRIECVVGDLGKPRFDLHTDDWDDLSEKIDIIYHSGALVNFAYPYSALRPANIMGTREVFRFACTSRLKPVNYVSTIDVLLATHVPRPFIEDDSPLQINVDIPGGYTGSKWVSEKIANVALQRGIPVSIFRPGLVMSHSQTGATQTNDYLLVALRGFLPKGIVPDYPRIFDIVPVDYVAQSIVHISTKKEVYGKFYHIFNPHPATLLQFCDWTKTWGYQFDIVPFDTGREVALKVTEQDPLYPLVPLIRDAESRPHRPLDPDYIDEVQPDLECHNTLQALEGSGIVCPPMNERLAHLCLEYLVSIGYFTHPDVLNMETAG
jgi:myxalamid-type nonribosomal peptide synthetase MxaA